jgi:hypothetical protein
MAFWSPASWSPTPCGIQDVKARRRSTFASLGAMDISSSRSKTKVVRERLPSQPTISVEALAAAAFR